MKRPRAVRSATTYGPAPTVPAGVTASAVSPTPGKSLWTASAGRNCSTRFAGTGAAGDVDDGLLFGYGGGCQYPVYLHRDGDRRHGQRIGSEHTVFRPYGVDGSIGGHGNGDLQDPGYRFVDKLRWRQCGRIQALQEWDITATGDDHLFYRFGTYA